MSRVIHTIGIVVILLFWGTSNLFAQLKFYPDNIEFKDEWHRLQNMYFINTGSQPVTVDSIYYASKLNYSSNYYYIRFNKYPNPPFTIEPGDTAIMDCILSGYRFVSPKDSVDTMFVATSSNQSEALQIKTYFYNSYYKYGTIKGRVTDGNNLLDSARVMFFYEGDFLYKEIQASSDGSFSASLPAGDYSIAVERPSYPLTFYDHETDPYCASRIQINGNDTINIDFALTKLSQTGISIGGHIIDILSKKAVSRGTIIVRRGTHTPSKINGTLNADSYTGIVNEDGSFSIQNLNPGSYTVQSFSSYYSPTFYTKNGSGNFLEEGDSIMITNSLTDMTIEMPRDSSIGAGEISGNVTSTIPSFNFCGITVYAFSADVYDTTLYSYTFADNSGNFKVSNLPYGSYHLVAQKPGYDNILYPSEIIINTQTPSVSDLTLNFSDTDEGRAIPSNSELYQNFPNPFNPVTNIRFYILKGTNVSVIVSNVLGQQISVLQKGFLPSGNYNLTFNANNLSSGIYFVTLKTDELSQTKKMILLK